MYKKLVTFNIGNDRYGFNISKVDSVDSKDIINKISGLSNMPNSSENIKGMFQYRDKVIPCIDLGKVLSYKEIDIDKIIVTQFNGGLYAFIVQSPLSIDSVENLELEEVSGMVNDKDHLVKGIYKFNNEIVKFLSLENIYNKVARKDLSSLEFNKKYKDINVMVAEDNKLIRKKIEEKLSSGDITYETFENGKMALNNFNDEYDLLITDIEMPEMDGIELSKKIKKKYNVPVLVFSSVINEQTKREVKDFADYLVDKPGLDKLINILEKILDK
ncbi:MAG: chemotaxis protein CheV [Bacillota bacterium]